MKTFKKIVYVILCITMTSCVRFVPQGGPQQGQQKQHQSGQRSFKPFYPGQKPDGRVQTGTKRVQTGTEKTETAYFEARLWSSNNPTLCKQASDYAARYFEKHHRSPSNEEVSTEVGFKCQVRRVR